MRKCTPQSQRGFTLIELLITILIIGILAAIGLAAYNGQRDKAKDSQAQTALRTALTAANSFFTANATYTGFTVGGASDSLKGEEATLTSTNTAVTPGSSGTNDPNLIYVDDGAAGSGPVTTTTFPANRVRIRLCSASRASKVFCIINNADTGFVRRYSGTTVANTIDKTGVSDW